MEAGEQGWTERFTRLVAEARQARGPERAGRVEALNSLLARLPAELGPERSAPLLQGLLEDPRLEGLEDEEGLSLALAATRVLVSLEGMTPLAVSPERLEALRRWERRAGSGSWSGLAAILLVTFVVQVGVVTLNGPGIRPPAELLAAMREARSEPTWTRQLEQLCEHRALDVFLGQLLANGVALLVAPVLATRVWGRRWLRRGLLGLGLLGLAVAGVQGAVGLAAAWGTLISVGGSLLAARWLRPR